MPFDIAVQTVPKEEVLELLRGVHDRVKHGFTGGASARSKNGVPVNPTDPTAVKFCVLGALLAQIGDSTLHWTETYMWPPAAVSALSYLQQASGSSSVYMWNDHHWHSFLGKRKVLKGIVRAIELAEV